MIDPSFGICYQKLSSGELSYNIVSKDAKFRNRYNQVPHLTQDTNGKVTNSQLATTNESHEVSLSQQVTTRHIQTDMQIGTANTTEKNIQDPQKKFRLGTVSKIFYWRA